eukprot:224395-Amphidinium_carterae.1
MERIYAGDADQSRSNEASEARGYRAALHRFTCYDATEDPEHALESLARCKILDALPEWLKRQ